MVLVACVIEINHTALNLMAYMIVILEVYWEIILECSLWGHQL